MAENVPLVFSAIAADDTWSDPVEVTDDFAGVAMWGDSFVGSVTVQIRPRWRDLDIPWINFTEFAGDDIVYMTPVLRGRCEVRAGIKTGNYTSGTANIAVFAGEPGNKRVLVTRAYGSP